MSLRRPPDPAAERIDASLDSSAERQPQLVQSLKRWPRNAIMHLAHACAPPTRGVCAYTNVCEHCPNFRSEPGMLAVLSAQRADARQLAQDAQQRVWNDEATRHLALIERLDKLIANSDAA